MNMVRTGPKDCSRNIGLGYLHPKAPSPGHMLSENTSQDWTGSRSNKKHTYHCACIHRTFLQLYRLANNTQGTLKNSRSAQTSDGSSNDEHCRISGSGRENRTDWQVENYQKVSALFVKYPTLRELEQPHPQKWIWSPGRRHR